MEVQTFAAMYGGSSAFREKNSKKLARGRLHPRSAHSRIPMSNLAKWLASPRPRSQTCAVHTFYDSIWAITYHFLDSFSMELSSGPKGKSVSTWKWESLYPWKWNASCRWASSSLYKSNRWQRKSLHKWKYLKNNFCNISKDDFGRLIPEESSTSRSWGLSWN